MRRNTSSRSSVPASSESARGARGAEGRRGVPGPADGAGVQRLPVPARVGAEDDREPSRTVSAIFVSITVLISHFYIQYNLLLCFAIWRVIDSLEGGFKAGDR